LGPETRESLPVGNTPGRDDSHDQSDCVTKCGDNFHHRWLGLNSFTDRLFTLSFVGFKLFGSDGPADIICFVEVTVGNMQGIF
jgi:hypothetical protein